MEAGDRVRTSTGQEGSIVILNDDRTLAYVRLDDDQQGIRLALYVVGDLTKVIDASP